MAANNADPEKGLAQANNQRASSLDASHAHANSQLETFQVLIGVRTPAELNDGTETATRPRLSLKQIFFPPRSVIRNIGTYQRALGEEWKNRIAYLLSSYVIDMLYVLQILLAATFTALSAYRRSSDVSLTVLGAINTVLAGVLALLKGQGMPNRFRKARDQYSELVRSIESTERLFAERAQMTAAGGAGEHEQLDPYTERDRLEKMFALARDDQQANYPDLYVSTTEKAEVMAQNEFFRTGMMKAQDEMKTRIEELKKELVAQKALGNAGQGGAAVIPD